MHYYPECSQLQRGHKGETSLLLISYMSKDSRMSSLQSTVTHSLNNDAW